MKVTCTIPVYEIDGTDVDFGANKIEVESHWNIRERVVLVVGGKRYTVIGRDLEKAIRNAENVR